MLLTENRPYQLLVLCTGNSARSIMGEALFNELGKGLFVARSAGSRPTGKVHPLALAQIKSIGVNTDDFGSKNVNTFLTDDLRPFDFVITVCDNAAEACPTFPSSPQVIHWSFPDPAAYENEAEAKVAFAEVFNELKRRIETIMVSCSHQASKSQLSENFALLATPFQFKKLG